MTESAHQIDREIFTKDLPVLTVKCLQKNCSVLVKPLKQLLVKKKGIKPIIRVSENNCDYTILRIKSSVDEKDIMNLCSVDERPLIKEVKQSVIQIGYDNLTISEVFEQMLPTVENQHHPSSFETIGHIAHLNLRHEFLPFKYLIGQVLLDKNKQIRTVINKTDTISNIFRTFPMELLAGDDDFSVTVKEHGCRFQFNFKEVYWNSKLQEEHFRLVNMITDTAKKSKVLEVADIFAGVGPFALPLLRSKNVKVFASDLNPKSFEALSHNLLINPFVNRSNVECFNIDAKDFIINKILLGEVQPDHLIMNLPDSALSFLKYFVNDTKGCISKGINVHCYCFNAPDNATSDILTRIKDELQCTEEQEIPNFSVRLIRNVAPNKNMYCAHFTITDDLRYRNKNKKPRIEH